MAKQQFSISNHGRDSSMIPSTSPSETADQGPQGPARSDTSPDLLITYPGTPPSTPVTAIFNPRFTPVLTPTTPSTPLTPTNPVPSPDQDITISLPATLKLTRNIIAALQTYITKMQADLDADPPRVPAIAIYEIRNAKRYQSVLKMKARRMELIQAVLDKHLTENGGTMTNVRWEERSQEIWAQELEYIRNARKYLIDSHVFYKINYELAK